MPTTIEVNKQSVEALLGSGKSKPYVIVVKDGSTGKLKLKASLSSKCGRTSVENEVEYIRQNIPGIFVDEED